MIPCQLRSTYYTAVQIAEKHCCYQGSHYESFPKEAITKLTLFAISKAEWDTKEDSG